MPPERNDAALLWDMCEAARAVSQFVEGLGYARFEQDRMVRSAVERQLLIIGEAARQVSVAFRDEHPEIPWRAIIGLRNVLAHEYGEVLVDRLWLVVSRDIPQLLVRLEPLVPDAPVA